MDDKQTTVVSDINIPFGRMVVLILQIMLAGIPAAILFYFVLFLLMALFSALFGTGLAMFGQ